MKPYVFAVLFLLGATVEEDTGHAEETKFLPSGLPMFQYEKGSSGSLEKQ